MARPRSEPGGRGGPEFGLGGPTAKHQPTEGVGAPELKVDPKQASPPVKRQNSGTCSLGDTPSLVPTYFPTK
jgi:hypothetical protein